jgi:hypothetical protein
MLYWRSYGLIIAWGSILCIMRLGDNSSRPAEQGDSSAADHATAHIVLIAVFGIARLLHTVVYLLQRTYLRSLMWAFALLAVIAMAINAAVAAFRA